MKVFLDTNVLISAFASKKVCFEVLQKAIEEYELVVGEVVLKEMKKILGKKIKLDRAEISEVLSFLSQFQIEPKPQKVLSAIAIADPDDAWVLASAIASGANVLVTGDKDLLSIARELTEITILAPRQFLERY